MRKSLVMIFFISMRIIIILIENRLHNDYHYMFLNIRLVIFDIHCRFALWIENTFLSMASRFCRLNSSLLLTFNIFECVIPLTADDIVRIMWTSKIVLKVFDRYLYYYHIANINSTMLSLIPSGFRRQPAKM